MSSVRALVLTGYGLNCDHETAYAFELAGARADRVHINSLIDGSVPLDDYQIMAFIGGFSWADDHGAGVVQAVRMRTRIGGDLLEFVAQDKLVIGICNGFQCLVNLGLLPALAGDYTRRSVALATNDCATFRDQWVSLAVNPSCACVFTRGLDRFELPVRHGEGKFIAEQQTIDDLLARHQDVLRYVKPDGSPAQGEIPHNPNGSLDDIAGICDSSGRVFGLMPHPEAYNHWTNHPDWTLQNELVKRGMAARPGSITPGIQIFKNAVDYLG
ncbi:MAG: phosphoribosylformylglycinamidine synthase subunit PurQ [Desulfosarcinaceae bacterium]